MKLGKSINVCVALAVMACVMSSCSAQYKARKSRVVEVDPVPELVVEAEERVVEQKITESVPEVKVEKQPEMKTKSYPKIVFTPAECSDVALAVHNSVVMDDVVVALSELSEDEYSYPAADVSHVTSGYGWRSGRLHTGVDIKVQVGDDIYAAMDGVVRMAKYNSSYGYCIVIHHYNGLETLYAHSSKLLVKPNQVVKAGDLIAYGGSTGRSTGSHLHFEVRVNGRHIDPLLVLDPENHSFKLQDLHVTMRSGRVFASIEQQDDLREESIKEELSVKYHTVRSGDTLSRIAANNRTTVATICRLNGISSTSILRIGQRLIVRGGVK